MLVSIIIVNWNRIDYLKNCIESLLKSSHQELEIIVVDNGSSDGSFGYIHELMQHDRRFVVHRNEENLGFALPSNQGAELATGDVLFCLNNDTIVASDCIAKVLAFLKENPKAGVVQPRLMQNETLMDEQGNVLMNNGYLLHFGFNCELSETFLQNYPIFSVKGAAFFVTRKVYEKIGLFRPEFFAFYEETDFCHRCWLAGFPVYYFGQAEVLHIGHVTARQFKQEKPVWIWHKSYYNRLVSLATLLSAKSIFRILSCHIFISLAALPILFVKGEHNIAKAIIWAHWDLIKNIKAICKQRKAIRSNLSGFTEDDLFHSFGLMTKPPPGYMLALAANRLDKYWEERENKHTIEQLISSLQKTAFATHVD